MNTLQRIMCVVVLFGFISATGTVSADVVLVDYNDGISNGIHDSVISDGEFTTTTGTGDPWTTLAGTLQFNESSTPDAPTGSARNYVSSTTRVVALDTAYSIIAGDTFDLSYQWIDKSNFDDATDTVQMSLYFTADNQIGSAAVESLDFNSGLSTADSTWETISSSGVSFTSAAVGKTLFVRLDNQAAATTRFARFDNIYVAAFSSVPEPSSMLVIGLMGIGALARRRR